MTRVLAMLTALTLTTGSASLFEQDTPGIQYYSTRVGEQLPVRLHDGSVFTLNTDTSIKVRRDGPTLSVEILRGEVHFNMLPDPERHLVVSVGDRLKVTDTATIFDVRVLENGAARVTVQEGEVKLSGADLAEIQLRANQQAAVAADSARLAVRTRNVPPRQVERELSWLQGYLDFQCETLGNAAREFNRYNVTQIEVLDDPTAKVQIGGTFSTKDPITFAEAMAKVSPNVKLASIQHPGGSRALQLSARNLSLHPQGGCTAHRLPTK